MKARLVAFSLLVALAALVVLATVGCSGKPGHPGLLVTGDPPELYADYAIFARRCSKCHGISRALESGFDTDAKWVAYVTRMRRQPASDITADDEIAILRYLRVRVRRQREARAAQEEAK
jgi:hypothetical protein